MQTLGSDELCELACWRAYARVRGWLALGRRNSCPTRLWNDLVDFGAVLRASPEEVDARDSTAGGGDGTKPSGGFATVALVASVASPNVFTNRMNTSHSGLVENLVGWD